MQQLLGLDAETPLWTWISRLLPVWSHGSRSKGCSQCYPELRAANAAAPTFHALGAKCCFPTIPFPYLPQWSHPSKVGVDSAMPSAVSTGLWMLKSVTGDTEPHCTQLQLSVGKMPLSLIMSASPPQAAWCVGCCLLSKSFWDICSCSACSDFAGTKIITERTGGEKSMHAYICILKTSLECAPGLQWVLKGCHKGDSFYLAAHWRSWIRKIPPERHCRFWKQHQTHSSALEFHSISFSCVAGMPWWGSESPASL